MNPGRVPQSKVDDRRRAKRQALHGKVRIRFGEQMLEGEGENVSHAGVLFYTDGDVHVEVEFEEDGVVHRRMGHLVRCERIRGDRRGWAVEFDRG
jgi:hypothetical protein